MILKALNFIVIILITNDACKYCGYNHQVIEDIICPISYNKNELPISNNKTKFFSYEVHINKVCFAKEITRREKELLEYIRQTRAETFN